jgi:hypothetical protein
MLRGVGNWGQNFMCGRVGELPAARPTETLHAGDLGSAVRAGQGEPCAALPTEPRPLRIRSLAPWTSHSRNVAKETGKHGEYTEYRRTNSNAGSSGGNRIVSLDLQVHMDVKRIAQRRPFCPGGR